MKRSFIVIATARCPTHRGVGDGIRIRRKKGGKTPRRRPNGTEPRLYRRPRSVAPKERARRYGRARFNCWGANTPTASEGGAAI